MTSEPVELPELLAAHERMLHELQSRLDADKRRFQLSLAANLPEWPLSGFEHLDKIPGLRWKLHNLGRLRKANAR